LLSGPHHLRVVLHLFGGVSKRVPIIVHRGQDHLSVVLHLHTLGQHPSFRMQRRPSPRASADLPREVWQLVASVCGVNELALLVSVCKEAKNGVYDAVASSEPPASVCDADGTSPFCNKEQFDAFVRVALLGKPLFLTGGAGTGKSFVTRHIVQYVVSKVPSEQVLVVAPTGAAARVASSAHKTAYTIHFAFCISNVNRFESDDPCKDSDVNYGALDGEEHADADDGGMDDPDEPDEDGKTPMPTARLSGDLRYRFLKLKLLVIDEISMVSNEIFTLMDKTLRVVRNIDKPFGGVTLLCVGDFCQLPPVLATKGTILRNQNMGGPWAFQSSSWTMNSVALRQVVRQKEATFASVLNRIRVGNASWNDASWLNRHTHHPNPLPGLSIFPFNTMCKERNGIEFNKLISRGATTVSFPSKQFATKLISTRPWKTVGILPDVLDVCRAVEYPSVTTVTLCVGSRVRAIKNIYKRPSGSGPMELQIANGQRGMVVRITERGEFERRAVEVDWDPLRPGEPPQRYNVEMAFKSKRQKWKLDGKFVYGNSTFMPLALAWAITVHSSQGASVDMRVDLNHCVVTKKQGQWVPQAGGAYVALSRATDISHVKMLKRFHPKDAFMDPQVKRFMAAQGLL
jgi:hypothetical protein